MKGWLKVVKTSSKQMTVAAAAVGSFLLSAHSGISHGESLRELRRGAHMTRPSRTRRAIPSGPTVFIEAAWASITATTCGWVLSSWPTVSHTYEHLANMSPIISDRAGLQQSAQQTVSRQSMHYLGDLHPAVTAESERERACGSPSSHLSVRAI